MFEFTHSTVLLLVVYLISVGIVIFFMFKTNRSIKELLKINDDLVKTNHDLCVQIDIYRKKVDLMNKLLNQVDDLGSYDFSKLTPGVGTYHVSKITNGSDGGGPSSETINRG